MLFENSFVVLAYTLKLSRIDHSYLKKLLKYRLAESHGFAMKHTVLTQISQSHGQVQNAHSKLIS